MACPTKAPGEGCPGYGTWKTLPNHQIEVTVGGQTFVPLYTEDSNKSGIARLQQAWTTYGDMITKASAGTGVSISYIMGILCAESLGNINACAPCGLENDCHVQNCQQCCAFGIMQFTNQTALQYVKVPGAQLLGNPELSFKAAFLLLADMMRMDGPWRYGDNLPQLAAAYNAGCQYCKTGMTNWFGNSENLPPKGGYVQRVVTFNNTFIALGLDPGSSAGPSAATLAGLALLAGAGVALWYFTRRR